MTDPQLDKGFIRIATGDEKNDVLMALVKHRLNATQYQIMLLVIRKTWGYNKKEDWISLTQFENYLSKSRTSITKEIKALVKNNILVKKSYPGIKAFYGINKDFTQWKQLVKKTLLGKKTHTTSKENAHLLVKKSLPTKETITKDNIQKKDNSPLLVFLEKFNKLMGSNYRPTPNRTKYIRHRLKTYTQEEILEAIYALSRSSFHKGENDRGWKADPDFLLRSDEQIDKFLNLTRGKEVYHEPIDPKTHQF